MLLALSEQLYTSTPTLLGESLVWNGWEYGSACLRALRLQINRGQELNTNFFSQTFRGPQGYPSKISGYPAKKSLISLVSRGIPNFLASTPSRGRPPPHRKISRPKSLGLGSFFFPELIEILEPGVCQEQLFLQKFRDFATQKNSFRAIENGQSIHHQAIPPLVLANVSSLRNSLSLERFLATTSPLQIGSANRSAMACDDRRATKLCTLSSSATERIVCK